MSLYEACGWTLLRSSVVTAFAIPICVTIHRELLGSSTSRRRVLWCLLLIPFFAPDLVVGYSYRNFALSLVHHPVLNESFYALLVLLKVVPVGVVVMQFSQPASVSPSAMHVMKLAASSRTNVLDRIRFQLNGWIRGPFQSAIPAAAILLLLSFQEFDLGSMLGADTWAVWLFNQHVQGLLLSESLRLSLLPVGCEFVLLAPLVVLLIRTRPTHLPHRLMRMQNRPRNRVVTWILIAVANVVVVLIPLCIVVYKSIGGLAALGSSLRFLRSIAVSGMYAITAALLVFAIARWLLQTAFERDASRSRRATFVALFVPGMFGSLLIGLTLLAAFQTTVLNWAYDTPMPLLLGFVLLLLPKACVLLFLTTRSTRQHQAHTGRLIGQAPTVPQRDAGRDILWHVRGIPNFWILVVLCYWLYLELTVSFLLHPTGMDPVSIRVYDFVHYGSMSVLAAMVALTMVVMLAALLLLFAVRRRLIGWLFT